MKILPLFVLTLLFFGLAFTVEAHQSGCHRWHSCPSDTGSYTCGDLGYACQYPTYSTGGSSSYTPTYSRPTTPSCPANSYYDGISSCKCSYGYVVSGNSCVYGSSYCHAEHGIFSSYDSLGKSCKCDAGYEMSIGGQCTRKATPYSGYSSLYSSYGAANSCPAHSSESTTSSSKCTCDDGYQANKSKTGCTAIPRSVYDKECKASYGRNSLWDGVRDSETSCVCKKKFSWNATETACVKK